jgi:hypothetical protein
MNRPSDELINVELAVAISLREQYGTNQPDKNYEDGVTEALLWVLGSGKAPNDVEYYHER